MSILRKSAKGQACNIWLPGCEGGTETTILAHKNGAGIGIKNIDLLAAFSCNNCHNIVDGRVQYDMPPIEIKLQFYEGIFRTIQYWFDNGYIEIKEPVLPKIRKILPRRY